MYAHTQNQLLAGFQYLARPLHPNINSQPVAPTHFSFSWRTQGNFSKLLSLPAVTKGNIICEWHGDKHAFFDEKKAQIQTNESRFR